MTTQLHKAPNERPLGRNQQISLNVKNATIQILMSADAEELTQQCGLSRDEAVLLIRLHGNKS